MKKLFKKIDNFFYLVTRAFTGLFTNGVLSLASVAVLVVCLLVTGSFYLIIENINFNIGDTEYLNKLIVYMKDSGSEEENLAIFDTVRNTPGVKDATFVSKAQALAEEKEKHPSYFAALGENDNPYRDSIVITYDENYSIAALEDTLTGINGVDIVKSRAEIANTVASLKKALTYISIGFFAALIAVTVFIIITTVKVSLYARKDEIALMYTIGATRSFITTPFILEGFVIGVFSSIIAFFLQWWIYGSIKDLVIRYADLIKTLDFGSEALVIAGGFAAIGIVTGIIGSTVSLGRYMERSR